MYFCRDTVKCHGFAIVKAQGLIPTYYMYNISQMWCLCMFKTPKFKVFFPAYKMFVSFFRKGNLIEIPHHSTGWHQRLRKLQKPPLAKKKHLQRKVTQLLMETVTPRSVAQVVNTPPDFIWTSVMFTSQFLRNWFLDKSFFFSCFYFFFNYLNKWRNFCI